MVAKRGKEVQKKVKVAPPKKVKWASSKEKTPSKPPIHDTPVPERRTHPTLGRLYRTVSLKTERAYLQFEEEGGKKLLVEVSKAPFLKATACLCQRDVEALTILEKCP